MIVPISWLKKYVSLKEADLDKLADALAMSTIGIKKVDKKAETIELEVTYNRSDLLSIRGVAREVAALKNLKFSDKSSLLPKALPEIRASVFDKNLCPLYALAKIENVSVHTSPNELGDRLSLAGMRPINNVVDITNAIMLDFGQPLHAFDAEKIEGNEIIVRKAGRPQSFKTLDGKVRKLSPDTLLICDAKKPVAVAGVIGGENSEVTPKTKTVFLEAAIFDPASIRKTAKNLGIRTEASHRFEHGLSPTVLLEALGKALELFATNCQGTVTALTIIGSREKEPKEISLSLSNYERLIGNPISERTAQEILIRLGCQVARGKGKDESLRISPPYWRGDINLEEDLIEEIARLYGYDRIEGTLISEPPADIEDNPDTYFAIRAREALKASGFFETSNYSFISEEDRKAFGFPISKILKITNPISPETALMRFSLWPNLLRTLKENLKHENRVSLYELGKIYSVGEAREPVEQLHLTAMIGGDQSKEEKINKIKQTLENIFLWLRVGKCHISESIHNRKGIIQQASIGVENEEVGTFGLYANDVVVLDLEWDKLLSHAGKITKYQEIPKHPPTIEDLSFIIEEGTNLGPVIETIKRTSEIIKEVALKDVYRDQKIGKSKKSVTVTITYQAKRKTLTDREVSEIRGLIIKKIEGEFAAVVRKA